MSDTEIAFTFDKDLGLVERKVPRTNGGASVTIIGTLSASLLQGSGSGGGSGTSSFPLDPVPTAGSCIVTDADGNPTVSTDTLVTVGASGVNITSDSIYNRGVNITTTNGTNYGLTIESTTGYNQGIDITSTTGYNQGINITSVDGVNHGIDITSTNGYNYGINITSVDGVNYGITISTSGGGTNSGLTITGGGGGVTVDGVNISNLALDNAYPVVQATHTNTTRILLASDAGDIIPYDATANAIAITIPAALFAAGGNGRAFISKGKVVSVAGGAITLAGSGGIVITYHGSNLGSTPLVAGDTFKIVVTSATSADVYVYPAV